MLLHRMALVSVRLCCKNLGNLQEFSGQMVYRPPPPATNSPYAYAHAALSSKKYPVVITQGRIFIGGVVVNSSKANILDALWEITFASA